MKRLLEQLAERWCIWRHRKISRPINGKYFCLTCWREFSSRPAIPETLQWIPESRPAVLVRLATPGELEAALRQYAGSVQY